MKKLSTLTLLVILGLGSILYSACKKENKNDPGKGKSTSRSFSVTPPKMEGGLLSFTDYDEYEAFQNYLIDEINKSDGRLSEDEILQDVEDYFGFTSLRKIALDEFESLNVVGWADPKDIPEEHWITSKVTRAVLNKDREVKIADKIVHYVNEDYMVTIDADQTAMIAALKGLPLSAPLEDILSIDLSRHYMAITGLRTNERFDVVPWGPHGPGVPLGTWYLNGGVTQTNPCVTSRTVLLSGLELWDGLNSLPNKGDYLINWGEGAPTTISSSIGMFGTVVIPLTKTYSSAGLKTITVSVAATSPSSSGGSYVVIKNFTVNVVDVPICHDFSKMDTKDYSVGATTFVRGHVKYDAWYNAFRMRDECKILSYTECYVTDDGTNWHRFRANWVTLCSGVQALPRDASCTPLGSFVFNVYHCSANTNTRYAEYTSARYHWKTVVARHEASFHGSAVGWDHPMNACE